MNVQQWFKNFLDDSYESFQWGRDIFLEDWIPGFHSDIIHRDSITHPEHYDPDAPELTAEEEAQIGTAILMSISRVHPSQVAEIVPRQGRVTSQGRRNELERTSGDPKNATEIDNKTIKEERKNSVPRMDFDFETGSRDRGAWMWTDPLYIPFDTRREIIYEMFGGRTGDEILLWVNEGTIVCVRDKNPVQKSDGEAGTEIRKFKWHSVSLEMEYRSCAACGLIGDGRVDGLER